MFPTLPICMYDCIWNVGVYNIIKILHTFYLCFPSFSELFQTQALNMFSWCPVARDVTEDLSCSSIFYSINIYSSFYRCGSQVTLVYSKIDLMNVIQQWTLTFLGHPLKLHTMNSSNRFALLHNDDVCLLHIRSLNYSKPSILLRRLVLVPGHKECSW